MASGNRPVGMEHRQAVLSKFLMQLFNFEREKRPEP